MHTPNGNTTLWRSEQVADPTHPTASNLASIWARGRRQITPWAYPRLRALAAVRFAVSIFLVGLGAVMLFHGNHGWAALPLAGAALNFSIAYLDITVARSASLRT
ncbi:MAG: hypothetical protein WBF34_08695 [Streptosporangiaceae bacterium]|jgi:hypothetical protein